MLRQCLCYGMRAEDFLSRRLMSRQIPPVFDSEPTSQENPDDIQVLGEKTRYLVVRAHQEDTREWLQRGTVCPLLMQHHISHVGIMEADFPFEIRRTEQSGTFMLACISGEGEVLA